ncbi:MAG: hypothetical protein AAB300_02985 [Nitrospirota bacterium]
MKKDKQSVKKEKSFEAQHYKIMKMFMPLINQTIDKNETLEQPHELKFVQTVTTYGAYQKPI